MFSKVWDEIGYAFLNFHQSSNISRILLGNKIIDPSEEFGASPVIAALTTSSFST